MAGIESCIFRIDDIEFGEKKGVKRLIFCGLGEQIGNSCLKHGTRLDLWFGLSRDYP